MIEAEKIAKDPLICHTLSSSPPATFPYGIVGI